MSLEPARSTPIRIDLHEDGRFRDLSLEGSYLTERVLTGATNWSNPVVIYGASVADDLAVLRRSGVKGEKFLEIDDLGRFLRQMRWSERFGDISLIFDLKQYRNLRIKGRPPQGIDDFIDSHDLESVIALVRDGTLGERRGSSTASMVKDFIVEIDKLCRHSPIAVSWPPRTSFFGAFVVAVWARNTRPFPLVIAASKSLNYGAEEWVNVKASVLEFGDLSAEIQSQFGVAQAEVEKAYWVWQLSRGEKLDKLKATTPKNISLENARQFLAVLTKSRPNELRASRLEQKAAPVIFERDDAVLSLRRSRIEDSPEIVKAGANSLRRQIERISSELLLDNVLPSARGVFKAISDSLDKIIDGSSDDGDIITIGVELEAFQHHVDFARVNIGDSALGELVGLHATAALFLRRFPLWAEYQNAPTTLNNDATGFRLSRTLLEDAVSAEFLSDEAAQKVNTVLSRAPADNSPKELREGLVRSSENLVAITLRTASEIVAKEAKSFASAAKKKAYEAGAASIVNFVVRHADDIGSLAQSRNWRWASWVFELLKRIGES